MQNTWRFILHEQIQAYNKIDRTYDQKMKIMQAQSYLDLLHEIKCTFA